MPPEVPERRVPVSQQRSLSLVSLADWIDDSDNVVNFPALNLVHNEAPLPVADPDSPEFMMAGQDGGDRPRPLDGDARVEAHRLQDLLRTALGSMDVQAFARLVTLMPQAQRDQLITLLRPLIASNLPTGSPRFNDEERARLTAALNRGDIPPELLATQNPVGQEARDRVMRFLTEGLAAERGRNELGPITRGIHAEMVQWLRRDIRETLRMWVSMTTDFPLTGCPLNLPRDVTIDQVMQALRQDTPENPSALITRLIEQSPFGAAINWNLGNQTQIDGAHNTVDALAGALSWANTMRSAMEVRLQEGINADTRINLAWLRRQGLIRMGWAPRVGEDRQEWYAAAGLRAEQARYATQIAQIIVGMRAMPGGENYPPGGRDPFAGPPPFPGTVRRGQGGRVTAAEINFPQTLDPTVASAAFDRQLAEWVRANEFVIQDFMRMFKDASDQWGILTYANIPMRGRIGENGPEYNLAVARFTTRREGNEVVITQTVTYHNSPRWNAHDIVDFEVGRERPREIRVPVGQLVPVMTSSGIALVRAEDVSSVSSDRWSTAWWKHNGIQAVGIGFDAIMCLTAVLKLASAGVQGTRALAGTLFRTAAEGQVNAAARRLFLRNIGGFVYSGLLGGTTFLTSSEWQNRRDWQGWLPNIRHAVFILDAVRNLPGALRSIGGVIPGVNRLAWVRGAAQEASATATAVQEGLKQSRWLRVGDFISRIPEGRMRVAATGLELALISQIYFGWRAGGGPNFQAGDIVNFQNGRNLGQANMDFLRRFVTSLTPGDRIPGGLQAIIDATNTHRPDMPQADRNALLNRLTTTIDNQGATAQERITAAIALSLILNREQREGLAPDAQLRPLNATDDARLQRALTFLESQAISTTLSHGDRLAAGQGLLALGCISPHAYANMLQAIVDDRNAPAALRQQCVLGMGTCLMLIRQMEDQINDPGTRSAYLAKAYRCTAKELEERLMAIAGGANGATDDMRAGAMAVMHALNRDNRNEAESLLTQLLSWRTRNPAAQDGAFARWYTEEMNRQMTAAPPEGGNENATRVYWENRLAAATALRQLARDNAFMTRVGSAATEDSIRGHLVEVARRSAMFQPLVATQAILALDNLDRLTPEQVGHVITAYEALLRRSPLNNTNEERLQVIVMREALMRNAHLILSRATDAQRRTIIETIAGFIDPARSAQNGGDGQFAGDAPDVREAAIRALLNIHNVTPLPAQVIRLIEQRALLVEQGGARVPNEPNPTVRFVAFEALRRLGYVARHDAGVNLQAIAETWLSHEPDLHNRLTAQNALLILRQQAMPTRQAIIDAGANPRLEVPAVTAPVPINDNAVRRWITARFPGLLEPPRLPDGTPLGPNLESSIMASINQRYGGFLGKLRFYGEMIISPIDYRNVRDGRDFVRAQIEIARNKAINAYIEQFNRLMVQAQGNSGEADEARRAVYWIARGGWRSFPPAFQEAAAIMSVRAITTLTEGHHSALACQMMESLIESDDTHPLARLILLDGLREHRDNSPNNSYQGRYTQILERLFFQLQSQRPSITGGDEAARRRAEWHYTLLGEVMHDLSFESGLRSPFFLSRLEAMSRDNQVPPQFRHYILRCLGRLYGFTGATYHALVLGNRPNPSGDTPQARATFLENAIRNPGDMPHALPLVEAIFNSVRGMPFRENDPRTALLYQILWTGSQPLSRAQLAACRAAFMADIAPGPGQERATAQIQALQRLAMLRLALIAEYGPGAQSGTVEWTVQEDARTYMQEFLLLAPNDAERQARQRLIDDSIARARAFRMGVNPVFQEVATTLTGPFGSGMLGGGSREEYAMRLRNLQAIAENAADLAHIDLVQLLAQCVTDVRGGTAVTWVPALRDAEGRPRVGRDGQPIQDLRLVEQMERQLVRIINNNSGDSRLRMAAALHVLRNTSLFADDAIHAALDAVVRLSNTTPAGNPAWLLEARAYVNEVMRRPATNPERVYITRPGRPPELTPVLRP